LIQNVLSKVAGIRVSDEMDKTFIGDESAIIDEDNIVLEF